MVITITVQDETWKMLNDRKQPGETFDSVIRKSLIEIPTFANSKQPEAGPTSFLADSQRPSSPNPSKSNGGKR